MANPCSDFPGLDRATALLWECGVSSVGVDIQLQLDGLAGLVRDLRASPVREAA